MSEVTNILLQVEAGDPSNAAAMFPLIYDELLLLAAAKLRREVSGQTFEPMALVHEAYLRLVNTSQFKRWDSRGHFFAAAAESMRRILVEAARRKRTAQKNGPEYGIVLEYRFSEKGFEQTDILALNEALEKFEFEYPIKAQIVKLRFFSGLSHDEIATALNLAAVAVKRYWRFSKVWLHRELQIGE